MQCKIKIMVDVPYMGVWLTSQVNNGIIWGPNLNRKCSPYPNLDPNLNHNPDPNLNPNPNHWITNRS